MVNLTPGLFSGIEAATTAWHDFDWECVGVSEIDPFPCEVLKQRYPHVTNYGDITKITKEQLNEMDADVIVGGSPCQSFSTGGKREGLADPRGRLMLEYVRVVETVRPTWFIWENVPGVLSNDGGVSFGTLLREMAKLGYHLCWRVLDAQHFGVPQRRRRVFLVGYLGADGQRAAKVLFDPEGRSRDYTKSGHQTKKVTAADEAGTYCDVYNGLLSDVAPTMTTATGMTNGSGPKVLERCFTQSGFASYTEAYGTLSATDYKRPEQHIVVTEGRIRRLTPVECERLQGFPDNFTRIKWRGKTEEQCPDGHRYKALGNSMAVPVMRWIGNNIRTYDERYYLPW